MMAERALQMVDQNENLPALDIDMLEKIIVQGDLSKLSTEQRITYYRTMCEATGLDYRTRPFAFLQLSGKLVLYALREATEQLRRLNHVSLTILGRELIGDVYVVTAQATLPGGRTDASTGAVAITSLRGEGLANAYMKAETKAKRRVTLSICGLGMLAEGEAEDIPNGTILAMDEAGELSERDAKPQQAPKNAPQTPPATQLPSQAPPTLTDTEARSLHQAVKAKGYTVEDEKHWLAYHNFSGMGSMTERDAQLMRRHAFNGIRPWQAAAEPVPAELVDVDLGDLDAGMEAAK